MLFSSYEFIFAFLPTTLIGFFLLCSSGRIRAAMIWLVLASLFFYGWWNPSYLLLLLGTVLGNYGFGALIRRHSAPAKGVLLAIGLIANLAVLGYFKYANFFVDNVNALLSTNFHLEMILLPLAISFYTFQQMAYLVDCYRGIIHEYGLFHYTLFVTFFPQLIAGPIVHHAETIPQFANYANHRFSQRNFAIGFAIFAIGLFKKLVIADNMAPYANAVFSAADDGEFLTIFEAWYGACAYTIQLYFDFSGYSDIAIGIARMFNIRLPVNFNSPLQATSIIDFWRRWHITLSRFISNYIFIPISMPLTRFSMARRFGKWSNFSFSIGVPVVISFLLAGIWHGAGWNFVIFGLLHGIYLAVNHAWNLIRRKRRGPARSTRWEGRLVARALTLLAILVAMVFFRAETVTGATAILSAMFGGSGWSLPYEFKDYSATWVSIFEAFGFSFSGFQIIDRWSVSGGVAGIVVLFMVILVLPNTQQILSAYRPTLDKVEIPTGRCFDVLRWRPSLPWAMAVGLLFYVAITQLGREVEFLYFNF